MLAYSLVSWLGTETLSQWLSIFGASTNFFYDGHGGFECEWDEVYQIQVNVG